MPKDMQPINVGMQSVVSSLGFVIPRMSGNSMRPLIWGEDHRIAVVPLDGEPVRGDILLFRQKSATGEEQNIVHRLVKIRDCGDERLYITRGDNCLGSETVRRSQIMGKVAEVHRVSGFRLGHALHRRKFAVTDRSYLIYSRIWMAIWPVRKFFYRVRGKWRV